MKKKIKANKSNKSNGQVSETMRQIKALVQAISEMKTMVIKTWSDETLPDAIKARKLQEMREALLATERYTLYLVEMAISEDVAGLA